MSNELPYDVITDILSKLPVKTLARFRCVCKSWCNIITSPTFITTHLNQTSKTTNHGYLVLHEGGKILRYDQALVQCGNLNFEFPIKRIEINGSIDGLVCMSHRFGDGENLNFVGVIFLWNPIMRLFKRLPQPHISYNYDYIYDAVIGFGFDDRVNDYKVVLIIYYYMMDDGESSEQTFGEILVYSLSSNSWKSVALDISCPIRVAYSDVYLNGVFHWKEWNKKERIMSFNFRDNMCGEIGLPKNFTHKFTFYLGVYEGSLAVSVPGRSNHCDIWVMKKHGIIESWVKQFTIDSEMMIINGQLLFRRSCKKLRLIDSKSQQITDHPIKDVVTYVESLLLLK